MANDRGNLAEVLDLGQDAFSDRRVSFHHSSLGERQRPGLLEESSREPDLPDVVDKTAHMRELLFLLRESQPNGNVTGIDGNGR